MKLYVNGKIVSQDKAVISVMDRGFLYGDAIFETMRSYNAKVFLLKDHLDRLYSSMKSLKIRQPLARKEMENVIYELLRVNNLKDAYMRVTVSRGESENANMDISKSADSGIVIIVKEFVKKADKYYEEGIKVDIASFRRNSMSASSNFKVVNYLESIIARNEALPKGFSDTVFLNESGFIAEASTSNIFMICGNKVLTPSLKCGILPGITRKAVINICPYIGLGMEEGSFKQDKFNEASEVFLTNSLIEIMPVVKIGNRIIGNGLVGKNTRKIHSLYKEAIKKEIGA